MKFLRAGVAAVAFVFAAIALLPVLLAGLPFLVVSYLTRAYRRRFEADCVPWQKIIEFDPIIGWKPKANLELQCAFPAGVFHLKTDAKGWRGTISMENAPLLVIGDSFAFGYGIDDKNAFFSLNHSDLRIKAIGSPGYNMAQEVIWMQRLSSQLQDKLVVWFICFSNDLYDNLLPNLYTYRMPFVRQVNGAGTWKIESSHLNTDSWPFRYEHNFRSDEKFYAVFGNTSLSERVYSACEFLIQMARDICGGAGARLSVVTIPWTVQLSDSDWQAKLREFRDPTAFDRFLPDRRLSEICSRNGIPLLCSRDHLDLTNYIPGDGHWNEAGHKRMAKILNELYRDREASRFRTARLPLIYGTSLGNQQQL